MNFFSGFNDAQLVRKLVQAVSRFQPSSPGLMLFPNSRGNKVVANLHLNFLIYHWKNHSPNRLHSLQKVKTSNLPLCFKQNILNEHSFQTFARLTKFVLDFFWCGVGCNCATLVIYTLIYLNRCTGLMHSVQDISFNFFSVEGNFPKKAIFCYGVRLENGLEQW